MNYITTDRRRNSKEYSGEVCRVCGSRDIHSREYGKPTMECIEHLRECINDLQVKTKDK